MSLGFVRLKWSSLMSEKRLRIVTVRYPPLSFEESEEVSTSGMAARVFRTLLGHADRECFAVLHLNARNRPLSLEVVSTGTLTSSLVHPREVFKAAILQNAAAIIVGHNHPSGDTTPSQEDHLLRERLRAAAELLGISMLDFLIIGQGSTTWSAADAGLS